MSNVDKQGRVHINHYPGHMAKTKRLIKENIKLIDLVYESSYLDERDKWCNEYD